MKIAELESCPDQKTLLEFMQGMLEPPTLGRCEQHISDCESCHETLRGLDANDTLSHQVAEAIRETPAEDVSDSREIEGLVQRLLRPERLGNKFTLNRSSNTELMADKAAEVLRCIEPADSGSDDCLGTLGDYRLLRLIGAGGTGVVFQAQDTSLDRVVALKVLRPSLGDVARERFIAEARLAASIEHDNVVTIYQIGQQGRLAFIAMQWIPGETLEARLDSTNGLLDDETIREFVSQIASGLEVAHQRQLVHRDIKPANIWICDDTGRIKILDFGLARVADEESSLTRTGMLAGTPSFMSPEQSKGVELDARSDLFSLGCVMYRLVTGRLPFSAPTILGTLQTIQSDSPQPPVLVEPDCDQDLSDLTMSLLEKLPANRMASAGELKACLNSPRKQWPCTVPVVKSVAAKASPAAAAPKTKTMFAGPAAWVATAVLASLLAVTAWWFSPQIIRIATNQGELVIETTDENIKVEVLKNGELFRVLDSSTGDSFEIEAGEYSFQVGDDDSSEFSVTPNSVELTRGGRKVVSVSITPNQDPKALAQVSNKLEVEQPFLRSYKISTDSKLALDLLSTILEGSDARVGQDETTGEVIVLGQKEDHARVAKMLEELATSTEQAPKTGESAAQRLVVLYPVQFYPQNTFDFLSKLLEESGSDAQIAQNEDNIVVVGRQETQEEVRELLAGIQAEIKKGEWVPTGDEPINGHAKTARYGGHDFNHWHQIAQFDREPQTVADGLVACAAIANENQKEQFLNLFRKLIRKHGTANVRHSRFPSSDAPTEQFIMRSGFIRAFRQMEPEELVSFFQTEIAEGNERSLGCCANVYEIFQDYPKRGELDQLMDLDFSLLLRRLINKELKLDYEVRSFLSYQIDTIKTPIDLAVTKEFLKTIPVDQIWLYVKFSTVFSEGELDEFIVSDFFDQNIERQRREAILYELQSGAARNGWDGKLIDNSDLRHTGASAPPFQSPNRPLLNRLLTTAILKIVNSDPVEPVFAVTPKLTINEGETFIPVPASKEHVVRYLVTILCKSVLVDPPQGKELETMLEFFTTLRDSEAATKMLGTDEFKGIKIPSDLNALHDFLVNTDRPIAAGAIDWAENVVDNFSHFLNGDHEAESQDQGQRIFDNPQNTLSSVAKSGLSEPPAKALYGGHDFKHWLHIAQVDRDPKTIADALAACATLADDDKQEDFLNLFRKLAREYGTSQRSHTGFPASGTTTPESVMQSGFIRAFRQMEPAEIVSFFQTEIAEGNGKSLSCCRIIKSELTWGDTYQKSTELAQLMDLDITLLLRRLNDKELKLDMDVLAFLEFGIRSRTPPDLEVTKEFLKTIPRIEEGDFVPYYLYSLLMTKFPEGELDDTIADFYFDQETERKDRDDVLSRLQLRKDDTGFVSHYGNPEWLYIQAKNGMQHYKSHNQPLLNRLLTGSILRIVESKQDELELEISPKVPGLTISPTDPILKQDAVRYLVTLLCQSNLGNKPEGEELEKMLAFFQTLRDSKVASGLLETDEFESQKIGQDLNALSEFLKSEPGTESVEGFNEYLVPPAVEAESTPGAAAKPELGVVTDVVTLNGVPLANAQIAFSYTDIDLDSDATNDIPRGRRGSSALTDEEGRYKLIYSDDVFETHGAIVGNHKVTITTATTLEADPEILPERYSDSQRTELMATVGEDVNQIDFDLVN